MLCHRYLEVLFWLTAWFGGLVGKWSGLIEILSRRGLERVWSCGRLTYCCFLPFYKLQTGGSDTTHGCHTRIRCCCRGHHVSALAYASARSSIWGSIQREHSS